MKIIKIKRIFLWFLVFQLAFAQNVLMAQNNKTPGDPNKYDIRELVMPSEVKGVSKSSGSIFYNPSIKGKVLVPIHFWGAIGKTGLHYLPIDTPLIKGLSFAGGPSGSALLDDIRVFRNDKGVVKESSFDVSSGGDIKAFDYKLRPGDTIFVKEDTFYMNRAYYTSLIGVMISILSSVLIYRQVRDGS